MPHDLVLRRARIISPNGEIAGDLAVTDGKIAAIGPELGKADTEIDATGLILMPGGIDSHCHLAQRPVNAEPECPDDFTTGTSAAALGGLTTVIPFSMCPRGADQAQVLADYLDLAKGHAVIDYGVHLQMPQADPDFLTRTLPRLAAQGFTSLKLFTTYEGYTLSDDEVLAIMQAAASERLVCLIHAEDDALIRFATARELAAGRTSLDRQPHARPIEAEAEAIHRLSNYAALTGARIHVFHVSGAAALWELQRAKARGVRISGETCPQYLTFTADDLARPDFEGAKFLCAPALRSAADRDALWAVLASDGLSIWSSDHSPSHRLAQIERARSGKAMPFTAFSGGMPGIQTLLPILFSEGVGQGRISLARFAELTAAAPARLFGLPQKGALSVGRDADLTLWDPTVRWRITHAAMASWVDFTPWEGMEIVGKPVMTISRGQIVMQDGKISDRSIGHGRLLRRDRVPA